ncbi:MAG: dihydrodipicolinate reductase C-terminal domain-containing protein, partial [Bacteroidales bacterium]
ETHHLNKKDAPSGTAIQLAKDIIQVNTHYKGWKIGNQKETDLLPIEVTRRDNVSGIHEITAVSNEDTITLRHEAGGLDGFALGSVLAAEFLYGKKGVFTVKDLLRNALQL